MAWAQRGHEDLFGLCGVACVHSLGTAWGTAWAGGWQLFLAYTC